MLAARLDFGCGCWRVETLCGDVLAGEVCNDCMKKFIAGLTEERSQYKLPLSEGGDPDADTRKTQQERSDRHHGLSSFATIPWEILEP